MQFKSDIYRTSPSAYIKEIMVRWFVRNIWWFVGLIALCAVLAFTVDTAFILAACMVFFIIVPMVLSFVYFTYGLRPQSSKWFLPRELEVTDRGINIKYHPDERFKQLPDDEFMPIDSLASIKIGEEIDVVYLGDKFDQFIIVPVDAFGDRRRSREQFHEYIYQSIQRNCVNSRS